MTEKKIMEILKKEYGISNKKEFREAVKKFPGVDIGLFTTDWRKKDGDETC